MSPGILEDLTSSSDIVFHAGASFRQPPEVADIGLGVLSGGGELAVPEDSLNVGDIGAALEPVRRTGMAQRVKMIGIFVRAGCRASF